MASWLDRLWDALVDERSPPRRPLLHRRCSISGPALAWVRAPTRTEAEQWAFAELLLRLDRDPVGEDTRPLLGPGRPPGLRWASFGGCTAIYQWDPGENRIRIIKCV